MAVRWGLTSLVFLMVLACSATPSRTESKDKPRPPRADPTTQQDVIAPEVERSARAALLEPAALKALQAGDFGLAELVVGEDARTTEELSKTAGFGSILQQVRADLSVVQRENPGAKVTSVMGVRLFDQRWLASPEMSFDLIGVVNRLDRRAFYAGSCGEIRFLYRLGYSTLAGGKPMSERLPMVINVVYRVDDNCREVADAWHFPADLTGKELAHWATEKGPLRAARRAKWRLKAVETNLQTVRWQSTAFATLAGHVEYVLRVFHPVDASKKAFVAAPLENTPDVARLSKKQVAQLLALLREPEQLQRIDEGTLTIPDRFLATKARSSSSRGMARVSNRPFRQMFKDSDFSDLDLAGYRTIRSAAALIRRLDAASCMGCHQSRSTAGFHLLGAEPDANRRYESLLSGVSPHLHGDLARRRRYTTEVAAGRDPDEFRPLPETQGGKPGIENAPCGLGDPGWSYLRCNEGLSCIKLEDEELGECQGSSRLGAACEYGTIVSHAIPNRDRVHGMTQHSCGVGYECLRNVQAFAQGLCVAECDKDRADSVCAQFLDIDGFQQCLRTGGTQDHCNRKYHYPLALRSCDDDHPCRPDHTCAQVGDAGGCWPTYFLFQLRADGYPHLR